MESGNPAAAPAAPVCTCGEDLSRNGGLVHNYACYLTPKCQHMLSKPDVRTGETIQVPCGSRLDHYICHSFGCPLLPLCPHCGTSMDQRGFHSIGCPNRPNYLSSIRHNLHSFSNPSNFQSFFSRFLVEMREMQMPVIPPAILVLHPSIIDGDFVINGQCCICHDECEPSQQVLKPSNCNHCFHENCLTPWIREHSTCPNCRGKIQTILRKN